MVICLERCAYLHMAQLMPLPLTVSCSNKIQIGFTFLVPAHLGSPGQRAVKRVCVLQGNSNIYKYKATFLWNFSPNSGFRKSRHTISIIELSSRNVDALSVINWTVVGRLKPRSQRTNSTELNCCARTAALQPINFVTLTRVTNDAS